MRLAAGLRRDRLALWAIAAPMALLALSTIYPILFAANVSLKTRREFILDRFALVEAPTVANYQQAWTGSHLGTTFLNSLIVTAGAVALLLLTASLAGYALAAMRFAGRHVLFYAILAGLMIPVQVIMVPFYQMIIGLDLLNTRIGLILSYTAFFAPFSVYLMTAFYAAVPRDLLDAAKVDGASLLQSWFHVMLPLGKPALITLGILNTLYCWNDVLISLLVMQDSRTLMVGIAALRGEYTTNIPMLAAGIILGAAPVILVYLVFQRKIVNGITVGAVKG